MAGAEQAFTKFCKCICDLCVLTTPLSSDTYRLQTDASGAGVGAVLSVVQKGEELPVAYFSRQLHGAEVNYSSTELEYLGVVAALKHFEVYLTRQKFVLMTDHQALTGMSTSTNHNRRLTRWTLYLQDFYFSMQYRPGTKNGNADWLSRQCWGEEVTTLNREACSSQSKARNRQEAAQNLQNPSTPGGAARTLEEGDVATRPHGIEEQNL